MKEYDLYGGLFWLLMAIFVSVMGVKFGLGTLGYPGPGFFPFLVGLILFCFSFGIIIIAFKEKAKGPGFTEWPFFGKKVFATLAILFAYSFSLEYLGFIIGSSLLMFYLFKVPGAQKWWLSATATVVTIALAYYFFVVLLKAQLPKGLLDMG